MILIVSCKVIVGFILNCNTTIVYGTKPRSIGYLWSENIFIKCTFSLFIYIF